MRNRLWVCYGSGWGEGRMTEFYDDSDELQVPLQQHGIFWTADLSGFQGVQVAMLLRYKV